MQTRCLSCEIYNTGEEMSPIEAKPGSVQTTWCRFIANIRPCHYMLVVCVTVVWKLVKEESVGTLLWYWSYLKYVFVSGPRLQWTSELSCSFWYIL